MSMDMIDHEEAGVRVIRYPGGGQPVKWRGDCDYCTRYGGDNPAAAFFPAHEAMRGCRSGGRNHCTCDGCF